MHSDDFLLTPSFTVILKCFLDTTPEHLVKSILDGSLYLGPFLKIDRNPLSGIQARSSVTTWPAGGYRNGESAQEQDD